MCDVWEKYGLDFQADENGVNDFNDIIMISNFVFNELTMKLVACWHIFQMMLFSFCFTRVCIFFKTIKKNTHKLYGSDKKCEDIDYKMLNYLHT